MRTPVSSPASFLNLDLELESPVDLSPLAKHLEGLVLVLHCGKTENGYHLCLEPLIQGHLNADPGICTEHMLSVIEELPPQYQELWLSCKSRVFDYGYDGGLEDGPLSTQLSPVQLERMVKLGLALRITLYPYRANDESREGTEIEA